MIKDSQHMPIAQTLCIVFLIVVFLTPRFLLGQEPYRSETRNRAAQYYLGTEDELLVPVNIWGFVERPGQYMVPNNTDLISLVSFAGGPSEGARISNMRIVRSDPKLGNTVFRVNVKRYIESADETLIPTLKPGDTIIVKGTTFHWMSRFFEFVSRLAVFAQIFYFIAIAQRYLD
jgi:hypothetical protein